MFNQAVADEGCCKFKQENQSKCNPNPNPNLNALDQKCQKKALCIAKHAKQQNEYYSTYSQSFLHKIFRCNLLCNH